MESSLPQLFTAGGITGTVLAFVYIGYKLCRRSKCTASCCGKKLSLDYTVGDGQQSMREVPSSVPSSATPPRTAPMIALNSNEV